MIELRSLRSSKPSVTYPPMCDALLACDEVFNSERQVLVFSTEQFGEIPNLILETSCGLVAVTAWAKRIVDLLLRNFDFIDPPLERMW